MAKSKKNGNWKRQRNLTVKQALQLGEDAGVRNTVKIPKKNVSRETLNKEA